MLTECYETLRAYALAGDGGSALRWGQSTLMARGMVAWIQVAGELTPPLRPAPAPSGEAARVPKPVRDELIQLMGEAVMTLARRDL